MKTNKKEVLTVSEYGILRIYQKANGEICQVELLNYSEKWFVYKDKRIIHFRVIGKKEVGNPAVEKALLESMKKR